MAERSADRKAHHAASQTKKLRPASTKMERSEKGQTRPQAKSASGPGKKPPTDDLLAKEEQYKLLNAQLEAKTADLVQQAEKLMREQNEVLSKPISTVLWTDVDDDDSRIIRPQDCSVPEPGVKMVTRKCVQSSSQNSCTRKQEKENNRTSQVSQADAVGAVEESGDFFLAKVIHSMEEKMNNTVTHENVEDDPGENVGSGISDAQIRVFMAKIRIMQEELDQLSCEYYKKEDENVKLTAKIKELEKDRTRLQKTTNIQQTQIEKHRALAEESAKKCDGLQLQVSGLQKEIENMNRSQKQAAAVHSTVEVRLNRAVEEVEKLKTQLNKAKQMNKDKISEEHQSKENLLAENIMLKKQKAELILGFKKQLKLIDILKRQRMHFEAAKLLSFTEDEFIKALDWGNS